MPSFIKSPSAVLDYTLDWSAWLTSGETIATATVTVPEGITLDDSDHTGTTVVAWLRGCVVGRQYRATCHIVTSDGREDTRTFNVLIRIR